VAEGVILVVRHDCDRYQVMILKRVELRPATYSCKGDLASDFVGACDRRAVLLRVVIGEPPQAADRRQLVQTAMRDAALTSLDVLKHSNLSLIPVQHDENLGKHGPCSHRLGLVSCIVRLRLIAVLEGWGDSVQLTVKSFSTV
jgi:hypothetical protein